MSIRLGGTKLTPFGTKTLFGHMHLRSTEQDEIIRGGPQFDNPLNWGPINVEVGVRTHLSRDKLAAGETWADRGEVILPLLGRSEAALWNQMEQIGLAIDNAHTPYRTLNPAFPDPEMAGHIGPNSNTTIGYITYTLGYGYNYKPNINAIAFPGTELDFNIRYKLVGSTYNDTMYGSRNVQTFLSGAGDDTLAGNQGNDVLDGGAGTDTARYLNACNYRAKLNGDGSVTMTDLTGRDGVDKLTGIEKVLFTNTTKKWDLLSEMNDWCPQAKSEDPAPGAYIDWLKSSHDSYVSKGGYFWFLSETLVWTDGTVMHRAWGEPDFTGSGAEDRVRKMDEADERAADRAGTIVNKKQGTAGNDTMAGIEGTDKLKGGAGNDNISGKGGYDSLIGGDGNDTIAGGDNADTVLGEKGADNLHGGAGKDVVHGGLGNDAIRGGWDKDVLIGGGGGDTFFFAPNFGKDEHVEDFGNDDLIRFEGGLTRAQVKIVDTPEGAKMTGPDGSYVIFDWVDDSVLYANFA